MTFGVTIPGKTEKPAMTYALDLSPRQTTRTLEQAVRHQAVVLLAPRVRPDDEPIACRLESIQASRGARSCRAYLTVVSSGDGWPASGENGPSCPGPAPASASIEACADLVGTYCDVIVQLGENRYLFCSDVVGVTVSPEPADEVRIRLARPQTIQVTQRRRSWRIRPARSSQVELRWTTGDPSAGTGIGWLCNVSGDGLACRVDARVADRLGIGEQVEVDFTLPPDDPDRFTLDAVLCSKTPAGTRGTMILGLQFLTGPGHESSADAAEVLRRRLLAGYTTSLDLSKGADA